MPKLLRNNCVHSQRSKTNPRYFKHWRVCGSCSFLLLPRAWPSHESARPSCTVAIMLSILQDLVQHKGHANAALLKAIREQGEAAQDAELRKLLHHIILANRFWLGLFLARPFSFEKESQLPESLEAIAGQYRETHDEEMAWLSQLRQPDLDRMVDTPFIPGRSFSVSQGLMQVCMHSHGHRAQCASRLRSLGGTPPAMDFITWLKER